MRLFAILMFTCLSLFAISPTKSIKADGNVIDIVYEDEKIIVATDNGFIEIFDINSSNLLKKIEFEKIKDFSGDLIGAKVFSVDKIVHEELFLAVLQGESFYRQLFIIENGKIKKILGIDKKLMIKKAKFIDKDRILIALMSNEIMLYSIKKEKFIYKKSISQSQFSDFSLNNDKSKVACAAESGIIHILNVENGEIIDTLEDGNVDNIYKLSFKNGMVLTAGQDRRAILYNLKDKTFDRYNTSFLIYACTLNQDAKFGAIAINQDNDIGIFDFTLKKKIATLKGQKSTLNTIVFIDDKHLVSGSDDKYIMIWSLK